MSNGVLRQLDPRPSILCYNVAADVRLTLISFNQDAVVATLDDGVLPEFDLAHLGLVISPNGDAILMGSLNQIVHDGRLIV